MMSDSHERALWSRPVVWAGFSQRAARARVAHAVGGDDGGEVVAHQRGARLLAPAQRGGRARVRAPRRRIDELRAPQVAAAPPHQRRVVEEAEAAAKANQLAAEAKRLAAEAQAKEAEAKQKAEMNATAAVEAMQAKKKAARQAATD